MQSCLPTRQLFADCLVIDCIAVEMVENFELLAPKKTQGPEKPAWSVENSTLMLLRSGSVPGDTVVQINYLPTV